MELPQRLGHARLGRPPASPDTNRAREGSGGWGAGDRAVMVSVAHPARGSDGELDVGVDENVARVLVPCSGDSATVSTRHVGAAAVLARRRGTYKTPGEVEREGEGVTHRMCRY